MEKDWGENGCVHKNGAEQITREKVGGGEAYGLQ